MGQKQLLHLARGSFLQQTQEGVSLEITHHNTFPAAFENENSSIDQHIFVQQKSIFQLAKIVRRAGETNVYAQVPQSLSIEACHHNLTKINAEESEQRDTMSMQTNTW